MPLSSLFLLSSLLPKYSAEGKELSSISISLMIVITIIELAVSAKAEAPKAKKRVRRGSDRVHWSSNRILTEMDNLRRVENQADKSVWR